jgi:hypothetical protein
MMNKDEALKMAMYELEIVGLKDGDTYNACKEALEQPAQEPVAWMYKRADGSAVLQFDRAKSTYGVIEVPLYEGVNND